MIGQLLDGRYQIIRALRGGGFGQTYVAQDTRRPGNPTCVVKHLKPATSDPNFLQTARRLFQSEAESLEQLGNHNQIPRLLAFFEENQEFFLVQEFIEGHPLTSELPEGQRWSEVQVIQMLKEVLEILVFVHGHGVIHRDIKPDNLIRRQQDQRLVLLDFGAVKQIRTQLVTTGQGQISATVAIGTPGYMPTEQGQGKPRPNSDIYAVGMIGIQALTGIYPHQLQEDLNTGELVWQHLVTASPGLVAVLEKMTRYHFKDRYQSAVETLQVLNNLTDAAAPTSIRHDRTPSRPVYPPQTQSSPSGTPSYVPSQAASQSPAGWVPPTTLQSAAGTPPAPGASGQAAFTPIAPPSRRLPAIIPLMIGCGAFAVVGFIGLIILAIAVPSIFETDSPQQTEARNIVGSLNRSQQAYRLETDEFSADLSTLDLGIPEQTDHYLYDIYTYGSDPVVMQVAIPQQSDLKSYAGVVWVENLDPDAVSTVTILCESDAPTQTEPSDPQIIQLDTGVELGCPSGFSQVF